MAAVLMAGSLVAVSAAPAGAACVVPASGRWTGTATSVSTAVYSLDASESFHADGTITGSVLIGGGGPYAISGTYDCVGNITVGVVTPISTFTGTLAVSGRGQSGTYSASGDSGTWVTTADPYALTATSIVQPTTISPGGASSWVLEVHNTGTAAATLVDAVFALTGSGVFGALSQSSVSQGTGCVTAGADIHCSLGTVLPGQKAAANVIVDSTGGAGSSVFVQGSPLFVVGGDTHATAPPVTISVVAPATLPAGFASGIAKAGVKFETNGGAKATPANPITVVFKLPKRVARGTTNLALSKAAKTGKRKRSLDGISLMSASKHVAGKHAKPSGTALGLPKIASVSGPSVPMSISRSAAEASTFCGGQACSGDVVHLTSFSGYNDRKHPAKVVMTWDKSKAGRGLGSVIFKRGDATTATTRTLGACLKTKLGYTNTPCVSKKKLVSGGDVQFTLLVLSGDPKFGRR
jgi:hypothetical protein